MTYRIYITQQGYILDINEEKLVITTDRQKAMIFNEEFAEYWKEVLKQKGIKVQLINLR
jgi:putative AlgH/UPF0301 family transcriptional regulator